MVASKRNLLEERMKLFSFSLLKKGVQSRTVGIYVSVSVGRPAAPHSEDQTECRDWLPFAAPSVHGRAPPRIKRKSVKNYFCKTD